jgi:light-regulated signal transduction histidine kinase (bacteriophytochrome)
MSESANGGSQRFAVTLENCAREPIHIPGSVQPHGILLAVSDSNGIITHASATAGLFTSGPSPVGKRLEDVLAEGAFQQIQRGLRECQHKTYPWRTAAIKTANGEAFEVLSHHVGQTLLLELEPAVAIEGGAELLQDRVAAEAARFEQANTVQELSQTAAEAVHRLSGFEKVMIYRFDEDWNGDVLAEVGPAEMESYLGLRFPASDIPPQARELYRINPVRLIADVDYAPSPLMAMPGFDSPLDLTYSVLRSVSPIHVEYLKNMRVGASMSISIIREGKLWGLIACHHRTARFIPHPLRSACVVLARLAGHLLSAIEARRERDYAGEVRAMQTRLLRRVVDQDDLMAALSASTEDLLGMVDADGAAICLEGEYKLLGATPDSKDIAQITEWLSARQTPVFHTDWLAGELAEAERFENGACGLLALNLSTVYRSYVIWFRSELVRTVNWAGNPEKAVEERKGETRLHPRKSFSLWQEQVGKRSRPWRKAELDAADALRQALLDTLLRKAEESAARAKDQFLAVLSHELRTPLSPVLTVASALEADQRLPKDAQEMMRIIQRNIELETRLIDDLLDLTRISKGKLVLNMETVDLHSLIERTEEVCEADLDAKGIKVNFTLAADAHHVHGDSARLQQVLWNILKNAIKFTPPGGTIDIESRNRNGGLVVVEITDNGVGIDPQVLPRIFNAFEQGGRTVTSQYGGLGLGLAIARTMIELHQGKISASSGGKGHGAMFAIELPAVTTPQSAASEASTAPVPMAESGRLKILLVEDHKDTARVMSRLLGQDHEVQIADSIAAARALAAKRAFDLVISDLGLPDGSGNDLMRELRARYRLKGIALTGWGMEDDIRASKEAGFACHLTKPVNFKSLTAAIRDVVGSDK